MTLGISRTAFPSLCFLVFLFSRFSLLLLLGVETRWNKMKLLTNMPPKAGKKQPRRRARAADDSDNTLRVRTPPAAAPPPPPPPGQPTGTNRWRRVKVLWVRVRPGTVRARATSQPWEFQFRLPSGRLEEAIAWFRPLANETFARRLETKYPLPVNDDPEEDTDD